MVSFRVPPHPAWWSPETPPCSPRLCRELAERDSEHNVGRRHGSVGRKVCGQ